MNKETLDQISARLAVARKEASGPRPAIAIAALAEAVELLLPPQPKPQEKPPQPPK